MPKRADRIVGLAVVALGLALALLVAGIEINERQSTLSARFFPGLLAGVLVLLGGLLALKPGELGTADALSGLMRRRGLLIAALFLLYCLTFRYVDFRLGTWAFTILALWILGSRKPLELILIPVAVSAAVYAVFRYGFTVLLPTWI
ncbi:MAG: hypothetical protein F4092_04045 [Rhodospirillaceae bacterium]|nr:hypothetical protein [Rhodospirillaceae bacterium]